MSAILLSYSTGKLLYDAERDLLGIAKFLGSFSEPTSRTIARGIFRK